MNTHSNNSNEHDAPRNTLFRGWVYAESGDYHQNLDPNWSYTPTYLQKMRLVKNFIEKLPLDARILDIGCGEGVLVKEYSQKGHFIEGIDRNYASEHVRRADVLALPYKAEVFDTVLLLDVFEHLAYADQPLALQEIQRVLKPGGILVATIPNLVHLNSRFRVLILGRLDRTDIETNHIGERPFQENRALLQNAGFETIYAQGITLTVPILYRNVICRKAKQFRWLHDLFEPIARNTPEIAMLSVFFCQKKTKS